MSVPTPVDRDQVQSFLGLAEYYSKFVKNVASIVQPLRMILKKGAKYEWSPHCEEAFNAVKNDIGKMSTLGHFEGKDVLCSVVNSMWVEASLSVALVVEFYMMRIPAKKRLGGVKKKQRCKSAQLMVDA
ncbi:hypothetical protein NDU88_003982 [Pleurodeles waltl]|uniref:Uncharacterized protein n=1 Tax=Pleurodeles waltl TaxID=8319 RepID=A0AAV7LK21_PLEWA|nr:hypothetical protein NDU88_003982 [Pleurodeles waltl]